MGEKEVGIIIYLQTKYIPQIYSKCLLEMYHKLIAVIMNYYNYKICVSGGVHPVLYLSENIYTCECHFHVGHGSVDSV